MHHNNAGCCRQQHWLYSVRILTGLFVVRKLHGLSLQKGTNYGFYKYLALDNCPCCGFDFICASGKISGIMGDFGKGFAASKKG